MALRSFGDGNIVNTQFTDLSRALDDLDQAVSQSADLTDAQKLDAAADLSTIRAQIAKQNPDKTIVTIAWKSLEGAGNCGDSRRGRTQSWRAHSRSFLLVQR